MPSTAADLVALLDLEPIELDIRTVGEVRRVQERATGLARD